MICDNKNQIITNCNPDQQNSEKVIFAFPRKSKQGYEITVPSQKLHPEKTYHICLIKSSAGSNGITDPSANSKRSSSVTCSPWKNDRE